MGDTFQLDVVTPEKLLVSGRSRFITVPGKDGRFGVLPGHTPLVSLLVAGELTVVMDGGGPEQRFVLSGGYIDVGHERVTVLVEKALEKGQIDLQVAMREEETAVTEMAQFAEGEPASLVWIKRRDFARVCQQVVKSAR